MAHAPTARRTLTVRPESWPIRGTFRISRESRTEQRVVHVGISDGSVTGHGECTPYPRYGESQEEVAATIAGLADAVAGGLDRHALQSVLPPGAARNALDAAFWDLEAKLTGIPVWQLADMAGPPQPVTTAFTLSVDTPDSMAAAARAAARHPLLKLKLTGAGDLERVRAVRDARPDARLIVDANEGWTPDELRRYVPALAELDVTMIEQPLPADADDALLGFDSPVPIGADEAAHTSATLDRLKGKYQVVNVKLDKTGGLTEALRFKAAAEAAGFGVMVGCMVGTSLGMAPAVYAAQGAMLVDLDGPLLLARDRDPGLHYDGATVHPPEPGLWGG